ncbi:MULTISPECIES: arylesterase [unclassified Novosphingobium]|uniref:arylesterase n=1 Tax=unclassified Novosphingobium TaxID=2644732 RepID=UPI000D31FE7A|nr:MULTISPECIES: arylesterase [unclassified Novosphingobium]PTR12342.1 acyl-CoA thioesterase-1 [Novosphingobium sp. GV055]PUB05743.1 acyl-CoA thioesterase-1 [Novosphingobium sp. GV061]PUB21976.1 acyl-CoA thioesterase-1 [Novosphingobium sp. GV079]PUB43749.1 acyl-CoA thioesterase-1 [Novosphingobium sp. GV027]
MRAPVYAVPVLAALAALSLTGCSRDKAPDALETRDATTAAGAAAPAPVPADAPVILAFGDSLYAGYQLDQGQSYPARLQAALNAAGVKARVINAGVSGDTTAAARQRLAFTLDNQPRKPALVMVGLGGNDMLRGLPPAQTRANLDAILAELKRRGIPVMLTGMLAAPNMGADYVAAFNPIWPSLAKKYDAALVPFFLQPIIARPALQLPDHMHPNAQGVDVIVTATQPAVAQALAKALHQNNPSPRA